MKNKFIILKNLLLFSAFAITSCGTTFEDSSADDKSVDSSTTITSSSESSSSEEKDSEIKAIYNLYLAAGGDMSYEEWLASVKGEKGDTGSDGVSISSIIKTGSDGLIDTYTITYSDHNPLHPHQDTFTVTNGQQGAQGNPGSDGHTPVITIGANGNWYIDGVDSNKKAQGEQGEQGNQGVSIVDTYINDDGDLIVVFSNTSIVNAGHVKDVSQYTVKFYVDEEVVDIQIVSKGSLLTRPNIEPEGYTINDWYVIDNAIHESWKFFAYTVHSNLNLYADYSYNQYEIQFVDTVFSNVFLNLPVTYNSAYVLPTSCETGYALSWIGPNEEVWTDGTYHLTSNVTLNASWTPKSLTLTLNPDGGNVPYDSVNITYNEAYSLPTPTSDSYLFDGWYLSDSLIPNSGTWTYAEEDATVVAHWRSPFVIEDNVLISCNNTIKKAIIPEGVTSIGNSAFEYKTALREVVFPSTLTSIGAYAFNCCEFLQDFTLPNGLTTIGDDAFYGCQTITSVEIPNTVTTLGEWAFRLCTKMTSAVIPGSISTIKNSAFYGCDLLTTVTIGNGVTSIEYDAFYGCDLSSIVIPNSVTSIGSRAFASLSNVTTAYIPSSVTTIGDNAFAYDNKLTIYCQASEKPAGWSDSWNYSNRPVVWDYTPA